jgi:L-ascorbate metabolism protein UlaG (beta-lactamase superfamily)
MYRESGNTIVMSVAVIAALLIGLFILTQVGAWFTNEATNTAAEEAQRAAAEAAAELPTLQQLSLASVPFGPVEVSPIRHATMVLDWGGVVMYTDPVGGAEAFANHPAPNVVLMSDNDPDHLDVDTIAAVVTSETIILAPEAVANELPDALLAQTEVIVNNATTSVGKFEITAVPMYNRDDGEVEVRHTKGRGNGYVIDDGSYRVYLAGDTANTPEFQAQTDIDLAFVPMNLPFTMGIAEAAEGVATFAPRTVLPYHFRQPDGFADIARFADLVALQNRDVRVVQLDWYPDTDEDGI